MISVECAGLKLQVPRRERRPWRFVLRILLALAFGAAGAALALAADWRLVLIGVAIEGLFFAHSLELAHSCIHGTALGSRRLDRAAGMLLSLPMLVSFSDYRDNHLKHHRTLGISEKKDFFGYEFDGMKTWGAFALHLSMAAHFRGAARNIARALLPWSWRAVPAGKRRATLEHLLMAVWLGVPLVALALGHTGPLLVQLAPLVIAAPCHVLVELPEHWRCVLVNDELAHSRSISASRLAIWFTNGNNYHFEHHLCPWLSNDELSDLHQRLPHVAHRHSSYLEFYALVLRSLRFAARPG